MSFRQRLERLTDNHYVLPRPGPIAARRPRNIKGSD